MPHLPTQSLRTTTLGDGGFAGGLDNHFNQWQVSASIMTDGAVTEYLPGSYKAVGRDCQHYNKALVDAPVNTAVPATVIQALYETNDHLPVATRFVLQYGTAAWHRHCRESLTIGRYASRQLKRRYIDFVQSENLKELLPPGCLDCTTELRNRRQLSAGPMQSAQ